MSTDLAPWAALGISALGWVPQCSIDTDQWIGIADFAVMMGRSSLFILGDLCNYAMERGGQYEQICQQWMTENGYAEQTGRNAAVIARLFPRHMRRLDGVVSFRHHEAVRNLARKDMAAAQSLLERAQVEGMPSEELRKLANARTETHRQAPRAEKSGTDADWRDGMLLEAAGLIKCWTYDDSDKKAEAEDWLTRYKAQREFMENQ